MSDDNLLADEVWLRSEFGSDEDSEFYVETSTDSNRYEVWGSWNGIRIDIPKQFTDTRGQVRRVVAFLRSFGLEETK